MVPMFPIILNQKWDDLMDFYIRALEINKTGWRVLNCFQFGTYWQVNLQMYSDKGTSLEYVTEFAQAETPLEALEAAFANAKARHPRAKPKTSPPPESESRHGTVLPAALEAKLTRAMDRLHFAIRMNNGTGSRDRDDDL